MGPMAVTGGTLVPKGVVGGTLGPTAEQDSGSHVISRAGSLVCVCISLPS